MSAAISNRELLEMAAKAVGLKPDAGGLNGGRLGEGFSITGAMVLDWHSGEMWNPWVDDGDCARMESALGIDVEWYPQWVLCHKPGAGPVAAHYKNHGGDRNAARRAASLQVAYAIGKAMP